MKKLLIPLIAVAAAAVLVALLLVDRSPRPLNVILISIDTLRPDRMGVYGHRPMGRSTTPFMDELAARGAVFTNAVSTTSWTLPGHVSLMSGTPVEVHGVVHDRLPPSVELPMLAEILKEAGYSTGGFYSGPYLHPLFGFGRGFDVYESCMEHRTMYDIPTAELNALSKKERMSVAVANERLSQKAVTSQRVTESGLRFATEQAQEPFFLFLHYFDVHNDYLPPPPYNTLFAAPYQGWVDGQGVTSDRRFNPSMDAADLEHLKALYDGEIAWVDHNIANLLRGIDPAVLENTLIIVTSDHGEAFFEHDKIGHRNHLYQPEIRIPLIVACPGKVPQGSRADAFASIQDVLPTILEAAGVERPAGVTGRSLLAAAGGGEIESRPVLGELTALPLDDTPAMHRHSSLIYNGMKVIRVETREWADRRRYVFDGPVTEERCELYDLRADPGERRDLSAERADLLALMLGSLDQYILELRRQSAHIRSGADGAPIDIPEELQRQLEQLGYGGAAGE